jgi:hypothetical protein
MGNAQNIETLLGSLLRIDVDAEEQPYGIPADNPFVDADGLDEIFAYGFRNPFRFSFDRETGELFLADVGQDLFEEINSVEMGGNYGWVIREGAHCFDPMSPEAPPEDCPTEGLIDPIAEYDHSEGLAVIGGYVYRGEQSPDLAGKYIFGDYNLPEIESGRLFYLETEGDRSRIFEFRLGEENEPLGASVLGFGEDADGELYVLTSTEGGPTGTTGTVYRIATSGAAPQAGQVPGDCNQDGIVDIADAICLFILLLGGGGEGELALPCAGAGVDAPGNLALLDWQGDAAVDVSDGVAAVSYLFAGGSPHMLMDSADPSGCVTIADCPVGPACP